MDGLAPTSQAVERTVLEYKILHLLKANGLKEGINLGITHSMLNR